MANSKNTDSKYWEKQLKEEGLAPYQPVMTDKSEGEMAEVDHHHRPSKGQNLDLEQLRGKIDGADQFMEGHQITKARTVERVIPEWVFNDLLVQQVLFRSFPRLYTNARQRRQAGRWARIIYLHYRMKLPRQIVAREMSMTDSALESATRSITRASKGLRANGSGKFSVPSHQHPVGESKEGRNDRVESALLHQPGERGAREEGATQTEMPMPPDG